MSDPEDVPPWPQQPGPGEASEQPADLLSRFLARLIDGVIVGVVLTLVIAVVLFGAIFDTSTGSPFGGTGGTAGFFATLVITVLSIAYFVLMESSGGQTLGKMIMKIRVRGPGGGEPTLEQATKRNLWMALSIIPVLGSLAQLLAAIAIAVTINTNRNGSGWHDDYAGGTRVVKV